MMNDLPSRSARAAPGAIVDDILIHAEAILRWWIGEAHSLWRSPHGVVQLFSDPIVCRLTSELTGSAPGSKTPVLESCPPQLDTPITEGLLWIDPALLYRRQIELPLLSYRSMRNALGFEFQRLSPLRPDLAFFMSRVEWRDYRSKKAGATLIVARKSMIEAAVTTASGAGLRVLGIYTEVSNGQQVGGAYPAGSPSWRRLSKKNRRLLLRAAILGGLLILALISPLARLNHARSVADLALLQAERDARQTTSERAALQNVSRLVTGMNQALAAQSAANLIAKLSDQIPDTAWLTQLDYDGRTLRIHGFANTAFPVLDMLAHSGFLIAPRFTAPVTRAQGSDLEEFEIEAEVTRA